MRWERLFADLDARFAELSDADMMAELADRQRAAAGAITMVQRLRGGIGHDVRIQTASGAPLLGTLTDVGVDWALLAGAAPGSVLIRAEAITAVEGLPARTGTPLGPVARRFDFRLALRGIARDRSPVQIVLTGSAGQRDVGIQTTGTVDTVGADFVELAQHPAWELRRAPAVRSSAVLPLRAIESVQARPIG